MTYNQVKEAYFSESFDLVGATQAQITKLENEFIKTGNEHGADWLQARYDDYQEEMRILTNEAMLEAM
tara:strand:- start:45 stop:248 length:204 start_codon:yes stop_codon:yes gene_type:complete